ncbi:MAG: Rpn family recombination-promoting nuclease/putative transposase, partial [Tepidanaerobacteraceae bacterium]|nr:Rpn family recombination-promoting nuclease/putative transposase [Tepidanaerobacteraceae bacterium]
VAKDFLNNYLPQNIIKIIDVDTLEPQKDSFINEELQESFSDLLFKADINKSEGYIYFLFEHKSYISKDIAFQLLKYMIEIWEAKTKKEKTYELPMIIPLVIYHGKDSWNIKTSLGQMITGYEKLPQDIKKYAPNYEYLLYDISGYTDQEIKGEVQLRIILTILRDIFTKDSKELLESILRAAKHLQELEDKQTGIEYFEILIRYIFSARADLTKKDMNKIIDKIENTYPEGSEVVMTLAEQLRAEGIEKGIEKGRAEGREEGREEALVKAVIKLLTKKFGMLPDEFKTRISKLDTVTLEIIIEDILEYKSVEDVKKYIS